jgi:hypothetical protein
MLFAFDQSPRPSLLVDAARSVLRQRLLRPHDEDTPAPAAAGGVPAFSAVDASAVPRRAMLMHGATATIIAWVAVSMAIDSGNRHMQRLADTRIVAWSAPNESAELPRLLGKAVGVASADRRALRALSTRPGTEEMFYSRRKLIALRAIPDDPLFAAIDADRNGILSAAEIASAPAFLGALDLNHDGALTRVECGGASSFFTVLDTDSDSHLSSREIANSARVLQALAIAPSR